MTPQQAQQVCDTRKLLHDAKDLYLAAMREAYPVGAKVGFKWNSAQLEPTVANVYFIDSARVCLHMPGSKHKQYKWVTHDRLINL